VANQFPWRSAEPFDRKCVFSSEDLVLVWRKARGRLMMTLPIAELAAAFHDHSLPKAQWTHHAHLKVGMWTLLKFSPENALVRLREGIRAYNESVGGLNTPTSGYHETITAFYVWAIAQFLKSVDRSRSPDELGEELIQRYGDKELPLRYWSKEKLMSTEARQAWVEPDLCPLQLSGV
jgi:hypothetical protein